MAVVIIIGLLVLLFFVVMKLSGRDGSVGKPADSSFFSSIGNDLINQADDSLHHHSGDSGHHGDSGGHDSSSDGGGLSGH